MTIIDPVREIEAPLLSPAEQDLARVAQRCIMAALDHSCAAAIKLTTDNGEQTPVEVPPAALKVIGQLLGAMGQGQSVVLMPMEREFTTVEAAHFLNVSRSRQSWSGAGLGLWRVRSERRR